MIPPQISISSPQQLSPTMAVYTFNTNTPFMPLAMHYSRGILTLAAPGDIGSLSANADLVIDGTISDSNSDGFTDGSSSTAYQLFNGGNPITLTNKNGKTFNDASTKAWDAIKAVSTNSGFQVLLDGAASKEGKYNLWSINSSGVITKGSAWKTADQATALGWETKFDSDLNGDGITGKPVDANSDGLVDGLTNYHIFNNGKAITIKNRKGRTYSDASTAHWDAVAATSNGSGFQVLLDGAASKEGKYNLWSINSSGVITKGSAWKTADQATALGWETKFDSDLNGDGITGKPVDANSDGLVDGLTNYHIFNNGKAITIKNRKDRTYSDASTAHWDAVAATSNGSGFQVLLDGAASKEGKYNLWSINSSGVITKGSAWKTADQATALGWETKFDSDLNGDGITGKPVDANSDGLVDGLTNYHIFNNGKAITIKNRKGRTYSDASTAHWDAVAATSNGSGFQVLLDGAASKEGKYNLWSINSSGVITKGSAWKTADQATALGWETKFDSDLNGDGITGKPVDANSDGLVDGLTNYHIFNNGKAITIKNRKGRTYSDASTAHWDAVAATSNGSGFQVLLDGAASKEGKYNLWSINSSGVITKGSAWKTADQAIENEWDSLFSLPTDFFLNQHPA